MIYEPKRFSAIEILEKCGFVPTGRNQFGYEIVLTRNTNTGFPAKRYHALIKDGKIDLHFDKGKNNHTAHSHIPSVLKFREKFEAIENEMDFDRSVEDPTVEKREAKEWRMIKRHIRPKPKWIPRFLYKKLLKMVLK